MTRKRFDRCGIESLPLKLIIISLILAISIPIVVSSWMSYDKQETINRLDIELRFLEAQIDQIYLNGMGIGNSKIVELRISEGTFTRIEYVQMGWDALDSPRAVSMRWKFQGEEERIKIISGGIPVRSEDGSSFDLVIGLNSLYLEVKRADDLVYVEMSPLQ
jgi:hypothetical protein